MNEQTFSDIAAVYHSSRPEMPKQASMFIQNYLGHEIHTLIDLGCGSGLSSIPWCESCEQVIGIDPNEEMLKIARGIFKDNLSFRQGFGSDTGLPEGSADAVVCSQSFHWMEPDATLKEIHRILAKGGVFAAIDYDWPPVSHWELERCFEELYSSAKETVRKQQAEKQTFARWDKSQHLSRIQQSALFRYSREILFSSEESCTAKRLYQMALSQSWIDTALKIAPDRIQPQLDRYRQLMEEFYGDASFPITFCYRMRIAVK